MNTLAVHNHWNAFSKYNRDGMNALSPIGTSIGYYFIFYIKADAFQDHLYRIYATYALKYKDFYL